MGCEQGEHIWNARFFQTGELAFWFCSHCGETDRDVSSLKAHLEDLSGFPDDSPSIVRTGNSPRSRVVQYRLPDGSVLVQGDPASVEFRGYPIPDLPDSFSYKLTVSGSGEIREYVPGRERFSAAENCFILTRYRVVGSRLVKYRIHCCDSRDNEPVRIDTPNGNTILSGLELADRE